jgi:RNA polymerase sigma-70 factor (ECF subfamily)
VDPRDRQDFVAAQAGDREAFGRLATRHWPALYQWLFGVTGCVHTAEDLAQEAFLRSWRHLGGHRSAEAWRTWLFRTALHAFIDTTRRKAAQSLDDGASDVVAARGTSPPEAAIAAETERALAAGLERLPVELRAALLLATQQDVPYAAAAAMQGVSEETARWRVYKARQLLLQMCFGSQEVRA